MSAESREYAKIFLGTSGWSYEEWVGPFYFSRERMFSNYVKIFNTAEINSTFYRYPSVTMIRGLIKASPKDFVFSVKMPKLITHEKELKLKLGVSEDLRRFLEIMKPMKEADKLGPILIQFPPSFNYDKIDLLERFLEILPSDFSFAVEFRSLSWVKEETWNLLRSFNVAYTIVDEPLLPPKMVYTADFIYIRWHGRGKRPWFNYKYSDEELKEWVPKIRDAAKRSKVVYGYFNNHFHAYAPQNCLRLLEMLGKANRLQREARARIDAYLLGKKEGIPSLPSSKEEALQLNISQLLRGLTDEKRMNRAETIRASNVSIKIAPSKVITAKIKEYTVVIDPSEKVMRHTCEDWLKIHREKRICKHVVRVFLSLPLKMSKEILADILINKDLWTFETF